MHDDTKKKKLRQYGILSWQDVKNAFMSVDDGTSVEDKQMIISIFMLFVAFFMSFFMDLIICAETLIPYVTLLVPIVVIVSFVINSCLFKEKSIIISKYTISLILLIYVLFIFFYTGGLSGMSSLWMIFLITFTVLTARGKHRINIVIFEIVIFVVVCILSIFNPNLVSDVVIISRRILNFISLFSIALFIITVIFFQTRIVEYENLKNRRLQEELKNNNDNLTARNEEIVSINENLQELTNQLNDALVSQKLFTASMNHELRAPLNGVMGGLQVLRHSDNLTQGQREIIEASFHSANALVHIVNDLLDYAKIEAGEFQIIKEEFNLKDIIDEIPLLLSNMMREKGLKYILEVEPDMPCLLYGDGTRIQQILSNLFSNAVKYTFHGSVTLNVKVTDNNLVMSVIDTGEGISDEAMEVLFTPFKRLNEGEHKKIQGTGLGLYVTHNLVNQMCGTISVESKVGVGTTFTVVLPIEIVDSNVTYAKNVVKEKGPDFSHMNILCVDDSGVNLMVFEKLISKITGAKIMTADSGTKALEILGNNKFDIIFLDFQMPELDGMQTLMNIRDRGITTPIVVLTGETGNDVEDKFRGMGFDGYVSKPMKPNEVIGMIARFAGMKNNID